MDMSIRMRGRCGKNFDAGTIPPQPLTGVTWARLVAYQSGPPQPLTSRLPDLHQVTPARTQPKAHSRSLSFYQLYRVLYVYSCCVAKCGVSVLNDPSYNRYTIYIKCKDPTCFIRYGLSVSVHYLLCIYVYVVQ